jgi:2-methylcitrate dehydratase PrpD
MPKLLDYVADRVLAARWDDLSLQAKDKLKLCILADLSVAIAGLPYTRLPPPRISRSQGGYLLFSGERAGSAEEAAFYNAAVMHARNQDDFHPEGRIHIGTIALPAALALAEHRDVSGKELLDALVAGYAAGAGLSRKFATAATSRGFRCTGVFGPFPSVGAAARLSGLDQDQTANALAIATSFAAGPSQCWIDGSDEWQLHAANGARSGIVAIEMSRFGTRGARRGFEGKAGFYQAVAGIGATVEDLEGQIDGERAIMESVLKRYSVSGINQSLVLAGERLLAANAVPTAEITGIVVRMHRNDVNYPGTTNAGPFHSFSDAMMSAPFCAASLFAHGGYAFKDMFRMTDPRRDELIARVTTKVDTAIPEFGAGLDVHLAGGRIISQQVVDPGADLDIGWDVVDAWAAPMWEEGGRGDQFIACKEIVAGLEKRNCDDLFALLGR